MSAVTPPDPAAEPSAPHRHNPVAGHHVRGGLPAVVVRTRHDPDGEVRTGG
jgi:hypothetical protein